MKTKWKVMIAVLVVLAALTIYFFPQIERVYKVMTLFDEDNIVENFMHMDNIFDSRTVQRAGSVNELEVSPMELPKAYQFQGEEKSVQSLIDETWTTGLVVLKGDNIVFEEYYRGNQADTKHISWSVAKSIVSALMGIAVEDGYIEDINEPVTAYVPFLNDTGYEDVPIKDVLQMSSGIGFCEDYGDFNSDINRMGRALAFNTSIDDFVASLEQEREPGTYNHYVSMDTQVLGMVLRAATEQNISEFMSENLWGRIGMEENAYWLLDNQGMELVFGGLNATLRDYARFGLLFLNEGKYNDETIIPPEWVEASVTPDAPHLMPGRDEPDQDYVWGYGYQWWLPEDTDGDYMAIGIYNQYIWIHPELNVVIAKNSAYPDYNEDGDIKSQETVAMFNSIAEHITK